MDCSRYLHRTSRLSHTSMKSTSTSSTSSSTSTSSTDSEEKKKRTTPVIRVVHIFNPTVIKTDPENFRSLVQELTGKSCRTTPRQQQQVTVPRSDRSAGLAKRSQMYIPERLGSISDIDIMTSFQEPVVDFSFPTMGFGEFGNLGLHEALIPTFPGF